MEKEIIEKIKEQLTEIKKISSEDRHFNLDTPVYFILKYLSELIQTTNNEEQKEKYVQIRIALDYTNDNDVKNARAAFEKARKKNAPFVRENEYRKKLIQAIEVVELVLFHFSQ